MPEARYDWLAHSLPAAVLCLVQSCVKSKVEIGIFHRCPYVFSVLSSCPLGQCHLCVLSCCGHSHSLLLNQKLPFLNFVSIFTKSISTVKTLVFNLFALCFHISWIVTESLKDCDTLTFFCLLKNYNVLHMLKCNGLLTWLI